MPESKPSMNEEQKVEDLSSALHDIYITEAKRQGDVRYKEAYADLPENIKDFDRVLARFILSREKALKERVGELERKIGEAAKILETHKNVCGEWNLAPEHKADDRAIDSALQVLKGTHA